MPTIAEWAFARIAECAPTAGIERQTAKIKDLLSARSFFTGRSGHLFGMICDLASLEEREKLNAACEAALRAWLGVLVQSDPSAHAELYRALTAHGDFADVPAPAAALAEEDRIRDRTERLERLEAPTKLLGTYGAGRAGIEALGNAKAWFGTLSAAPPTQAGHRLADFTYVVTPEWGAVAGLFLPPDFLPIADAASGDFLGVLLDAALLRRGIAPVVLYFHEHDPAYTWVFESASIAVHALDAVAAGAPWAEALRGNLDEEVRYVLQELNDPRWREVPSHSRARAASRRWLSDAEATFDDPTTLDAYQSEENRYAVTHLAAQRIWTA